MVNGSSSSVRTSGRVDGRQHFAARAPVVLWKIDFDPRISSALDDVQRPHAAEVGEDARQPVADAAGADDRVHRFDQYRGAVRSELRNADVLAVRMLRRQRLVDLDDAAA